MEMNQAILTSAYLGSVGYYSILASFDSVLIEQFDSYHKQTCRNRCQILAANGPLDLIIPVVKESGRKTLMKDVKIDYATRWQNIHWRSLFSAYNSSPFFEYYSEYFIPFYHKRWVFLLDLNLELTEMVLGLFQVEKNFRLTDRFQKEYETSFDLRNQFSTKQLLQKEDLYQFNFERYTQTFAEKFGFVPDLSIVDLLFNCGPASESILIQNKFGN
jgi:hypothetical protein